MMYYYLVCPIGVIAGKQDLLTYHFAKKLAVGSVIEIPFGKKTKRGVVFEECEKPNFTTKEISKVFEEKVPPHLLELGKWMSDYYAARLSIVLQTILPSGIGKNRRAKKWLAHKTTRSLDKHPLTKDQAKTIKDVKASHKATHLIHGVTGSGKTRVYQELAKEYLSANKSVFVLVPEIALTPQLAAEFEALHDNVLVIHSAHTEAERHSHWKRMSESNTPWVVVGPRSALFSPLTNVGLIIVDECHEPSYKQDSQPKYSALRVAGKLAQILNAKLLLGSATPSVTDYFVAKQLDLPIHTLRTPTRARSSSIDVIDMRERDTFGTHPLFSRPLIDAMNSAIAQNEQILLFHNRRGTARISLCAQCGWTAECPHCHIPMRLHHDHAELRCHICNYHEALPQTCPDCKSPDIDFKGFGSKRIETEIRQLFPDTTVARFDSDTPNDQQVHQKYQDLYDNKVSIIIGTQGIAKGLDLPHLTTVGIVQADSELFIPDFSSSERSFQLITQVIGRAGRTGAASRVIIQTLNPDHPAIIHARNQDYDSFYQYEINERTAEHMPPLTHLLHLTTGYSSAKAAQSAAQKLRQKIKNDFPGVHVRGPSPAFHEHRGKLYYQQLIISSSTRSDLVKIARELPQRWQFTLDPINLL